jgi:arginase
MALAILTGRCWKTLMSRLESFAPLTDDRVLLVGARDVDPGERELLAASDVTQVGPDLSDLERALDVLANRARRVYLHVDLDVHDPAEAPANTYGAAGGPSCAQVLRAVERIGARFEVAAAGLAAYDPAADPTGRTAEAAVALARSVARFAFA